MRDRRRVERVGRARPSPESDDRGRLSGRCAPPRSPSSCTRWSGSRTTRSCCSSPGARRVLFGRRRAGAASTTAEKLADAQRRATACASGLGGDSLGPAPGGHPRDHAADGRLVVPLDSVIGTNLGQIGCPSARRYGCAACRRPTAARSAAPAQSSSCSSASWASSTGCGCSLSSSTSRPGHPCHHVGRLVRHRHIGFGVDVARPLLLQVQLHPPRWSLRQLWRVLRLFYCALGTLYSYQTLSGIAYPAPRASTRTSIGAATFGSLRLYLIGRHLQRRNRGASREVEPRPRRREQQAAVVAAPAAVLFAEGFERRLALPLFEHRPALPGRSRSVGATTRSRRRRPPPSCRQHRRRWHDDARRANADGRAGRGGGLSVALVSDEMAAPGQKHAALTTWAATRKTTPTIWLDKACIQQDAIDEALARLPVFLAGRS